MMQAFIHMLRTVNAEIKPFETSLQLKLSHKQHYVAVTCTLERCTAPCITLCIPNNYPNSDAAITYKFWKGYCTYQVAPPPAAPLMQGAVTHSLTPALAHQQPASSSHRS